MWLIRLHKLQTKDYNMIARSLEKMGFSPRKVSPIVFVKASLYHLLHKKSWRSVSAQLGCNYFALYNFYSKHKKNPDFHKIFHSLAERFIIVYIEENIVYKEEDFTKNKYSLKNTESKLKKILNLLV